jgi:hypothetical protein
MIGSPFDPSRSLRSDRERSWVESESGSTLVAAASLGVLVAIIGLTLATRVTGGANATAGAVHRERALSAAEAMVAQTLERFASDPEAHRFLTGELVPTAMDRTWSPVAPAAPEGTDPMQSAEGSVAVTRASTGELLILASGRSAGEERSLEVVARSRGVTDYLWLTDLEVLDPILTGARRGSCHVHGGLTALPPDSGCRATHYGSMHVFDGPFHSNDAVSLLEGVTFHSAATSAWVGSSADGRIIPGFSGATAGAASAPFGLGVRSMVVLPIAREALEPDVTCRFRGPTVVRFKGGSIRVRSPLSVRGGDVATGPVGCPGLDLSGLDAFVEVELPETAVIEVAKGEAGECSAHPLGITADDDKDLERRCFSGDAFVWGGYRTSRTLVAHDDVVLVWDVRREPGADAVSVLGLVAGDSIVLRRPVGAPLRVVAPFGANLAFGGASTPPFGGWPLDAPLEVSAVWDAPTIEASLVALGGSVRIENPSWGKPHVGPVTIHGSVAQRFRGTFEWERFTDSGVLQARMGYELLLRYDSTFLQRVPPGMPGLGDPTLRILRLEEVLPGGR